jgi:putative hydrolase of the HAD superfamily
VGLPAAVVFDLDDTLLDTSGAEAAMLDELALAVGAELPQLDAQTFHSRFRESRDDLYLRMLRGELDFAAYRTEHLRGICAPWGTPSDDLIAESNRLRDGRLETARFLEHAVELLAELRDAGVRTTLLTNGPSPMQRRKVALLGLEAHMDAIGISEELGATKPDAAAFERSLALIGAAPADAMMVGDHLDWDVHGALGAGLAGAVWVSADAGDERGAPPGALRVAALRDVRAALEALSA